MSGICDTCDRKPCPAEGEGIIYCDFYKNDELKPCPFCGGEARVREGSINGRMRVYALIEHTKGCFFQSDYLPTKYQWVMESEFDAWNTRAQTVFGMTLDEVRQMIKRDAERERTCYNVSEYAEE